MTTRRIAVVTAGIGVPSSTRLLADRLAVAAESAVRGRGDDVELEVLELRPLAHALADNVLTGFPNPELQAAVDTVRNADALIAVTPIFRGSYSGLFKMFIDVLEPDAMAGKPVLLAATAGTARHSLVLEHAMRPLFSHLRLLTAPTAVFAAPEDWAGADAAGRNLADRVERAAGELVGLLAGSPVRRPVDEFAEPTPFEDLLRGI